MRFFNGHYKLIDFDNSRCYVDEQVGTIGLQGYVAYHTSMHAQGCLCSSATVLASGLDSVPRLQNRYQDRGRLTVSSCV